MLTGIRAYINEMWEYRHFWFQLVRNDLRKRYRRSLLGLGWSLAQPIAMTIVLATVYSRVLNTQFLVFAPSLLTGLAFWTLLHSSCVLGCGSFLAGESFIRQQPLPTLIFPLRVVLTSGFHFLISLLLAIIFVSVNKLWIAPALLTLLPSLLLLGIFAWSVATLCAYAHIFFPDTQHLMEVGLQVLFYLTPIVYPPSLLEQNGMWWLLEVNPVAHLLQLIRDPILRGQVPELLTYAKVLLFVLPLSLAAGVTVARLERRLIYSM